MEVRLNLMYLEFCCRHGFIWFTYSSRCSLESCRLIYGIDGDNKLNSNSTFRKICIYCFKRLYKSKKSGIKDPVFIADEIEGLEKVSEWHRELSEEHLG